MRPRDGQRVVRLTLVNAQQEPDSRPDKAWLRLVIDTVGFNESFWWDRDGSPHTEQLHTIERFTRTDAATLRYELTIDDPQVYTKPWLSRDRLPLKRNYAAAKVRAGTAVEVVARLAHQVHGAIGFTQEHKLHHLTRRLWSWRDEAGSELAWSRVLGAGVLADGPDALWPALTRVV